MNLYNLIQSIDSRVEIIDSYIKKSFFGEMINYVAFKIGSHYYLVSELNNNYILTEQTPDGSKDISLPIIYKKEELKKYIKSLINNYYVIKEMKEHDN